MLPLFDNKMTAMTKANWRNDFGRNDQIHHDTVYMQIVCFCFGFSFKIESTLEKMEVSNICVCLGSNYIVSLQTRLTNVLN